MAVQLADGFRAVMLESGGGECPDEEDFGAIFALLGDREGQEAIRQKNPHGVHCELLKADPSACETCPKNPHLETLENESEVTPEQQIAWAKASELMAMVDAGLSLGPRDLTAIEFEILLAGRIASSRKRAESANISRHNKINGLPDLPPEDERRRRAKIMARLTDRARTPL